jgi:DNA-binding MarR family transcriptional regulator
MRELQAVPGRRLGVRDLAERLGRPASQVLRQIAPLERIGIILRTTSGDGGGSEAGLTEVGDILTTDASVTATEAFTAALDARWSAEEQAVLAVLVGLDS